MNRSQVEAITTLIDSAITLGIATPTLKAQFADTVGDCVRDLGPTMGAWEKWHICQALGALSLNICQVIPDSVVWLRVALASLEATFLPHEHRSQSWGDQVALVTHTELLDTCTALQRKLRDGHVT